MNKTATFLLCVCVILPCGLFAAQASSFGPITWGGSVNIGGGWGRMVQLTNGSWLCVTAQYPAGTNSYLRIQRSFDGARTWSEISQVKEPGRTLDNGELIALKDGTILLAMRSLIPDVSYKLPVYASTNNGLTWVYRSNIDTSEGLGGKGLWEPDFWLLDSGQLLVTYSNEKHPGYSQVISQRVSGNNGITWGTETWPVAQPGGGNLRPGMSQVARMANGRYILVYEIVNLGNADVYFKTSTDGTNWPGGLGRRIPCQHCGPFVTCLPNGLVLVSSCENQVSFSEDFGETWQKIDPPAWDLGFQWTWPAIYSTRHNEVGVMVVNNGTKLRFGMVSPRPRWPEVFAESFDDNDDQGWSRYGGNFRLDSGRYTLEDEGVYGKALTGDVFWSDGVMEADMNITSPGNAGLVFRATNPDYDGPDAMFGYYAGLDTAGVVMLGRMDNSWSLLTNRPVAVGLNTWHHLKVELRGSSIRVFVDDLATPKLTWTDSTHKRGQIGVRAFQCDAQFDNVSFWNTAPLELNIKKTNNQLNFNWGPASATVKLFSSSHLGSPLRGVLVNPGAWFDGAEWKATAFADQTNQFFWLQAQ